MVLTWPMVLHPGRAALGSPYGDGMKHLWTLWWMRASVWREGRFPFHTDLVNWPVGMDLYPIEPLNGLVAVLLPFVPVVPLANLLVFGNLVGTGLAGHLLGREVSGRDRGGLVTGTLLEGSAVTAFFVHVGVGELLHLWLLPLGLAVLLRARRTLEWRWFGMLAAVLAIAVLACFYLGLFLGTAVAAWALATLWAGRRTPALLVRYVLAAALAVAVVLPIVRAFSTSYAQGSVPPVGLWSYVIDEHGQPVTDPASARLEPAQLWTPRRPATTRQASGYSGGRYLGWTFVGLALAGLVRRPRAALPWLVVALVGFVLATGTYLTMGGAAVKWHGLRLRMPLFWLNRVLGYLAEPINFPVRFLAVSTTALAAMASLAVRRWEVWLAPLALLEIGWGQMIGWPWATFAPVDASGLEVLADEEGGAVIDLGLAWRPDQENRTFALSAQMVHQHPIQAIPIERIEYFARDGQDFVSTLSVMRALSQVYLAGNQRSLNVALVALAAIGPEERKGELALMRDAGFRWLVLTWRAGSVRLPAKLADAVQGVFGPAVVYGNGVAAWRIPDVELPADQLAKLRAQHELDMRAARRRPRTMGPPSG